MLVKSAAPLLFVLWPVHLKDLLTSEVRSCSVLLLLCALIGML